MAADKVLLPGVGDASVALASLRSLGLDSVIPSLKCPVLGICVGMQVMCRHSEEGDAAGLESSGPMWFGSVRTILRSRFRTWGGTA